MSEQSKSSVSMSSLAHHMELSVPSASEMMKKLAKAGVISYNKQREVSLTETGRKEASSVVRRHRLSERLLTDVLGISWDKVHDEACRMEHAISPAVEEKLDERLGFPKTCPHGHSIPDASGATGERELFPLVEIETGAAIVISQVSEEEPGLLRYLADLKLMPGTESKVEKIAPFGGPITLLVGNEKQAIGPELAAKIMVERLP